MLISACYASSHIYSDTSGRSPPKEGILTQDPHAVFQGLHSAGLHGHAEHGLLPTDGAHLVLLGRLLEHHQQLVGDDGVEHGNDDHGEHKGDEGVDLQGREGAQSGIGSAEQEVGFYCSKQQRSSLQWKSFPPLTQLVLKVYC